MKKTTAKISKNVKITKSSAVSIFLYATLLVAALYPFTQPNKAQASVTEAWVRFDRLATGSGVSGTACMETTGGAGTETGVIIDFPTDWTISGTPANWTVTTTNLPTSSDNTTAATAWPGIGTATAVTGVSVRFPSTDLSDDTFYCFNFAGASSTVGAAGNDKTGTLKTEGGSPFVEEVQWATSVVASGADQITVTASVSASMTFSLSGNSVDLGTLSSGSTAAGSAITQTISTNARNGWISWVMSNTDGGAGVGALDSTAASAQIDSPGSFDGSPETLSSTGGYVLDVNSGTGSPTIGGEYNGTTADEGGHLSYNVFRQTASNTAPASGDTADLVVKARSSATTPPASDYTDTLTVVAAGSF